MVEFIKQVLYIIALVSVPFVLMYAMIGGLFFPGFRPLRTMCIACKQRQGRAILLNRKGLLDFLQQDGDVHDIKMHDFMLYGKLKSEPIYLRTWDWFIMGQHYSIKQRRASREEKYRAEQDAARKAYAHINKACHRL